MKSLILGAILVCILSSVSLGASLSSVYSGSLGLGNVRYGGAHVVVS